MSHPHWDPGQYARHADARLRPGFELMARLPALAPGTMIDLGCGTGEHLKCLASLWPGREAIGVDLSPDMIARAQAAAPELTWRLGDASTWAPEADVALLFSNAALQWLDNHARLIPRLFSVLAPGGVLAVQMPSNQGSIAHEIARTLCREIGCADLIEALRSGVTVLDAREYFDLLSLAGARDPDIWETTYLHPLGPEGVTDWMKGAALRPVLSSLSTEEAASFLEAYDERVRRAYPARADGTTLFAQRRVFMVARRP